MGPAMMSRRPRWLGGLVALALVALAVRERFEPFLLLRLDDVLGLAPDPVTVSLGEDLALRAYEDTRPHVGKIDELQKGLVLVVDGRERIEEGFGFGAPIVRYGDMTYLSRAADIAVTSSASGTVLSKVYTIAVADYPVQILHRKYRDVAAFGEVVVTYTLSGDSPILVSVDLSRLDPGWDEVFLMNEQGARAFTRYQDGSGVIWPDLPGIWDAVRDDCGCWIDPRRRLRFCVETANPQSRFIGRERYVQYYWAGIYSLSWSGIDLHVTPPDVTVDYRIHIERLPADERSWHHVPCS